MRCVYRVNVTREREFVILDVTANAFLHHMVRNIAGVLIAIGVGERPMSWVADVLGARDRRQGGITAAPGGLYLAGIRYAESLRLPSEAGESWGAACRAGPDQV
jgi:tRNA pseudouridine38-40 synthase